MGIPAFLGISLHSLLDGVALGAGLIIPELGPVVLLAVIIHKMPDGISISSILLSAGWNRRTVGLLSLLFSLTTPVGAIVAYISLRAVAAESVAIAIGISAGTFLAIATADILPQVHRIEERNPMTLVSCSVAWLSVGSGDWSRIKLWHEIRRDEHNSAKVKFRCSFFRIFVARIVLIKYE
jgi:zinc transporter ZupT